MDLSKIQNLVKAEAEAQAMVEKYLKAIKGNLDEKAYERLMNVRIVNPELYMKAVYVLFQLKQMGRIKGIIDDKKMKSFLLSLLPRQREGKIIRK